MSALLWLIVTHKSGTRWVLKIRQIWIDILDKLDFPVPLFGKEGIGEIFFFTDGSIVTVINCYVAMKTAHHANKSPLIPLSQRGNG